MNEIYDFPDDWTKKPKTRSDQDEKAISNSLDPLMNANYIYIIKPQAFINCIDTCISTYQLPGDTFIMNKYLNEIVTTIYYCYI